MLNLYAPDGTIQFDKDLEATRQYFIQHVLPKTVTFDSLEAKLTYLVENDYYEEGVLEKYTPDFRAKIWAYADEMNFRFKSFLGAFKYYTAYTLKTFDGQQYLERFEDRAVMVLL